MYQAEGAHHFGVRELLVEARDLRRQQQAFINDGAGRERRDVENTFVRDIGPGHFRFHAFADDVELALERLLVHAVGATDEDLLDVGLGAARHAADGGAVGRDIAPAEHREALFAHDVLQDALAVQALVPFNREKGHAHAVFALRRQREAELAALPREKVVRDLDDDAGAVAGLRVASAGAAVREIHQYLNSLQDDVVGTLAADAGHEADPAGIVLVARVVKTLGCG